MIHELRKRIGRALLRETAGTFLDADDWMYSSATASGETVNDLNEYSAMKQRRLARNQFFRSPVGGALAEMSVDRVISGNVQYSVRDREYQAAVDEFSADPYNDLEWLIPQSAKELWVFGEVFAPAYLQPENGDVRLGYIKPDDVKDVIWEPGNEKRAVAVVQKRPKADEPERLWIVLHPDPAHDNGYPPQTLRAGEANPFAARDERGAPVILPNDGTEVYPAISRLLEKDSGVVLGGCLFYHRSNCLMTGRGRSRYERVNDWIKALDDWFFGILRNAVLQGSFVWDVRIKGATPQDIKNRKEDLKRSGPPRPGSVNLHNDQEEWSALSPSLSPAASIREILGGTLRLIGLASGLPGHEVGAEQDTNRSTAQESRSISTNRAKSFQREICLMASEWIRYMLDQKRYLGVLPEVPAEERRVEWVAAELDARDETQTADSVRKLAEGLIPLLNAGLILAKDARTVIYNALEIDAPSDEEMAADAPPPLASTSGKDEEENSRSTENIENILSRFGRSEGSIEEILSDEFASTEIWEAGKGATPAGRPRTDVLRWRMKNGRPIPITEPKGGRGSHEEPTPSGHPASPSTKLSLAALGRQRRERRASQKEPTYKPPTTNASTKRSLAALRKPLKIWRDKSGWISLHIPIPEGVNVIKNARLAERHVWDVYWFRDMVQKTGPWDFKGPYDENDEPIQPEFADFGDYHYGYIGAAACIPINVLKNEAGGAQGTDHSKEEKEEMERVKKELVNHSSKSSSVSGTAHPNFQVEQGRYGILHLPFLGSAPYGDAPKAQELIEEGYNQYHKDAKIRQKKGEYIPALENPMIRLFFGHNEH